MPIEEVANKALSLFRKHPEPFQAARVALRKMRPDARPPLEAVALAIHLGARVDGPPEQTRELFTALQLAAILSDLHVGRSSESNDNRPAYLGRALEEAKVSERRLERLLRARRDQKPQQLRAIARQLLAKNTQVDVRELIHLLVSDDDRPRLRIAQSYYRAAAAQEKSNA